MKEHFLLRVADFVRTPVSKFQRQSWLFLFLQRDCSASFLTSHVTPKLKTSHIACHKEKKREREREEGREGEERERRGDGRVGRERERGGRYGGRWEHTRREETNTLRCKVNEHGQRRSRRPKPLVMTLALDTLLTWADT